LSVDAIRRQMDRDEQFAAEVRQAETRPELLLLRQITAAAADPRQWRAAAWLLERKYFERYARRGPTTIGSEQLADALAELASVLVAEVRNEADRERVRQRIASLVGRMEQDARRLPAPSEAPDGEP
jgi:hypothetical protein